MLVLAIPTQLHAQTGSISTNPTQCTIPAGQSICTTQISWSSSNATVACVWRTAPSVVLWSCDPSGSQSWPWIVLGQNTFELRAHSGFPSGSDSERLSAMLLASASTTGSSPVASNGAQFISQTVPGSMVSGQAYSVAVTLKNTGNTTWSTAASYRLGSRNPTNNSTWGLTRVDLPGSVAPNEQVTINFVATAPVSAGVYNFQWQMSQDGVQWFGELSHRCRHSVACNGM